MLIGSHPDPPGASSVGKYRYPMDVAPKDYPGGRPKLPAEIQALFQAKSEEALEVLTRCLQSDDDRIAMLAAQAILDRGYGKPAQTIDASITEGDSVRFYAEVPKMAATTEEWLAGNPVAAQRNPKAELIAGVSVAVDKEQAH
jgi:hypothetical protein